MCLIEVSCYALFRLVMDLEKTQPNCELSCQMESPFHPYNFRYTGMCSWIVVLSKMGNGGVMVFTFCHLVGDGTLALTQPAGEYRIVDVLSRRLAPSVPLAVECTILHIVHIHPLTAMLCNLHVYLFSIPYSQLSRCLVIRNEHQLCFC